jgi:MFS family permease
MTAMAEAMESGAPREGLFSPRHRVLTTALMMLVTLLAFDEMSIGAVMPVIARELHGMSLYAWAFSATLLASLVGTVVGGGWADAAGPAGSLLSGVGAFLAGLAMAGFAPDMLLFVTGRAVQGLGAGAAITSVYVLVARCYPERMRPKVFAATSAAWVVPSLIGPTVAALVAVHLNWRAVFFGLMALVVPAAIMLRPALRAAGGGTGVLARSRLLAVVAVAAGVVALLWGADHRAIPVVAVGVVVLGAGLPRLLPAGTLRLRRGLGACVAMRGLISAAFVGTQAFVPLGLISLHHFTPTESGAVLTVGALGWSGASWVQGRSGRGRPFFAVLGTVCLLAGVAGVGTTMTLASAPGYAWLMIPAWVAAGAGMGFALPAFTVIVMDASSDDEQGVNSSALQITDTLGASISTGLAGAIVAAAGSRGVGIEVAEIATALVAMIAVTLAHRVKVVPISV